MSEVGNTERASYGRRGDEKCVGARIVKGPQPDFEGAWVHFSGRTCFGKRRIGDEKPASRYLSRIVPPSADLAHLRCEIPVGEANCMANQLGIATAALDTAFYTPDR